MTTLWFITTLLGDEKGVYSSFTRMRGLLVRVGIDSTCGAWNGPVDLATGDFVYVPIPESKKIRQGCGRSFDEFTVPLSRLGWQLPTALKGILVHLDPDFEFLTYGDQGARARLIREVADCDQPAFLAFYAALRDVTSGILVDALIGIYHITQVLNADEIPRSQRHENAHTRREENVGDVVVRAAKGRSGRFQRCIVIGRFRDRAHRVDPGTLTAWGGLTVCNGYIQRSVRLPEFLKPFTFLAWLAKQQVSVMQANNSP